MANPSDDWNSSVFWPKSLKNYIVVWPDGLHYSLPNIFSFIYNVSNAKTSKGVWAFLWNHNFFLFGQNCYHILSAAHQIKKNLGLIFKNHFSTVLTYHPSSHKTFFKVVSYCVFNLSSEHLKLIFITSFAR